MNYAEVILLPRIKGFGNAVTYELPEEFRTKVKVGSVVKVPFQQRSTLAVVSKLTNELPTKVNAERVKPIDSILVSPVFSENSVNLISKISAYYQTSLNRVLKLFLPKAFYNSKIQIPEQKYYSVLDPSAQLKGERQIELFDLIKSRSPMSYDEIRREIPNFSATPLTALVKKGILNESVTDRYECFDHQSYSIPEFKHQLTAAQEQALGQIESSLKPVLLHGVTGSGKTEIYLRRIIDTIKSGRQAILLVPEIALTPQTVQYFEHFFGDHIALFHSGLSDGERLQSWWKAYSGYAPLVIGSRSAIFAPLQNLGLIIIDEEHEWTYKQESTPHYQTQQIAEWICEQADTQLILGSATPSVESYHKSKTSRYLYINLPNRVHEQPLPPISIVDLREEFKKRNFSIFSLNLQQQLRSVLEKGEQAILFVNQRGLANAVACRDCGYTERCDHCEISLKYHRYFLGQEDQLVCHYCGFKKQPPTLCPECRSAYIKHIGVGTQRVEQEVENLFPSAKVVRADKDTTSKKNGFSDIYHDFAQGKYDILVGTQMIAKGLDFSRVTLIGVVLADVGLHLPDFRSSERLFQLITQVAGRCGRAEHPGAVVLQTYNPDHPTIQAAANYGYSDFIERELKLRKQLNYPPFNRMIKFTVVGDQLSELATHIKNEEEALEDIFKLNNLKVDIVSGPALIAKQAGRYYYHVLIRSEKPELIFDHWRPPVGWRTDVDPVHTA